MGVKGDMNPSDKHDTLKTEIRILPNSDIFNFLKGIISV